MERRKVWVNALCVGSMPGLALPCYLSLPAKCTTDIQSVKGRYGQVVRRTTLDFAQDVQHQTTRTGSLSIDETEVSGYRTND